LEKKVKFILMGIAIRELTVMMKEGEEIRLAVLAEIQKEWGVVGG
jgi:hypothetical protein